MVEQTLQVEAPLLQVTLLVMVLVDEVRDQLELIEECLAAEVAEVHAFVLSEAIVALLALL